MLLYCVIRKDYEHGEAIVGIFSERTKAKSYRDELNYANDKTYKEDLMYFYEKMYRLDEKFQTYISEPMYSVEYSKEMLQYEPDPETSDIDSHTEMEDAKRKLMTMSKQYFS